MFESAVSAAVLDYVPPPGPSIRNNQDIESLDAALSCRGRPESSPNQGVRRDDTVSENVTHSTTLQARSEREDRIMEGRAQDSDTDDLGGSVVFAMFLNLDGDTFVE